MPTRRRHQLAARIATRDANQQPTPVAAIKTELRSYLADWRRLLKRGDEDARQLLRLLVVGRLRMVPEKRGYRFEGKGTMQPVLEGNVPTAHCPS